MDFEESTGSSDKEVVLDESGAEGKTSEDEIFEESKSEDSSSDDNEKAQSKGSKAGNQTTNGDSQKSSSSAGARGNNLDAAAGGSRLFSNSGPDSVDANAAERIKSTTLRRQRKQVERFVIAPPTTSRDKSIVIPEGAGTKLQDIPYVAEQINVSCLYTCVDNKLITLLV